MSVDSSSSAAFRQSLLERYRAVRAATEALAAGLSPEDQLLQSMPNASPTKWHRAHTSWFFEEFVLGPRGAAPFDAHHRFLFNSYYEAVGARQPRPRRGLLSRPSCEEVGAYRRAVDGRMLELLAGADEPELAACAPLVVLGLAHEEQHQELLLTDILHAFAQSPLAPAYRASAPASATASATAGANAQPSASALRFHEHPGGLVTIGHDGAHGFAFDNEGPRHRAWLEPFALASRPINVGEVRAFIAAGGYREPRLWLSDGLDFVRREGLCAPAYTRDAPYGQDGERVWLFGLDGVRAADDDEPASHLTYYEADAIARFLGARLPTEIEWEVFACRADPNAGNFRETGALRPVGPRAASETDAPRQLFGDVWEWTASAYAPYPGFAAAAGAVGEYNGKFMVNQQVLRGGSCLTPRGHVRASYRNFWAPDTSFQMTGARLARSLGGRMA